MVVKQLDDWPVYKAQCPPTGNQQNPTYQILHWNCLMLVPSEDDTTSDSTQLLASAAIVFNACMGTLLDEVDKGEVLSSASWKASSPANYEQYHPFCCCLFSISFLPLLARMVTLFVLG